MKKWLENWRKDRDEAKMGQIIVLYRKFYSLERRKKFLQDLTLMEQFTPEELETLSNILGREAHGRVRMGKALDRAREYYMNNTE